MNAQEPWMFEIATVYCSFYGHSAEMLFIFCASNENFDVNSRSYRASGSIDRSDEGLRQRVSEKSCELERWDFQHFFNPREGWPTHQDPYLFRIVKNIGNSRRPLNL